MGVPTNFPSRGAMSSGGGLIREFDEATLIDRHNRRRTGLDQAFSLSSLPWSRSKPAVAHQFRDEQSAARQRQRLKR